MTKRSCRATDARDLRLESFSMRVLVACEFSGTVREAFAMRGHDAYSCDLLDSEKSTAMLLNYTWDAGVIMHGKMATYTSLLISKRVHVAMRNLIRACNRLAKERK